MKKYQSFWPKQLIWGVFFSFEQKRSIQLALIRFNIKVDFKNCIFLITFNQWIMFSTMTKRQSANSSQAYQQEPSPLWWPNHSKLWKPTWLLHHQIMCAKFIIRLLKVDGANTWEVVALQSSGRRMDLQYTRISFKCSIQKLKTTCHKSISFSSTRWVQFLPNTSRWHLKHLLRWWKPDLRQIQHHVSGNS